MKMRKLSPTGDYTYGQGLQDFCTDIDAVRQLIQTRLQLYQGTFWRDITAGFPLFTILGGPGSPNAITANNNAIQNIINTTQGVSGIVSFSSSFDSSSRAYSYTAQIQTQYSNTVISGTL